MTVSCAVDNLHVQVVSILLDIKIPAIRMQVGSECIFVFTLH